MADPARTGCFRYEVYQTCGDVEWMLVHGPSAGPRVLILPPFFAEANATRALLAGIARHLAAAGIGSAIPDLPGTGESQRRIETIAWGDWRRAARDAAAALDRPHVVSLRGGALLDDACDARSRWRYAVTPGSALLRQLERAQAIGDREGASPRPSDGGVAELAGYRIADALRDPLRAADPIAADGALRALPYEWQGIAPWRRAEPGHDPALAAHLAHDIVEWIATCAC